MRALLFFFLSDTRICPLGTSLRTSPHPPPKSSCGSDSSRLHMAVLRCAGDIWVKGIVLTGLTLQPHRLPALILSSNFGLQILESESEWELWSLTLRNSSDFRVTAKEVRVCYNVTMLVLTLMLSGVITFPSVWAEFQLVSQIFIYIVCVLGNLEIHQTQ